MCHSLIYSMLCTYNIDSSKHAASWMEEHILPSDFLIKCTFLCEFQRRITQQISYIMGWKKENFYCACGRRLARVLLIFIPTVYFWNLNIFYMWDHRKIASHMIMLCLIICVECAMQSCVQFGLKYERNICVLIEHAVVILSFSSYTWSHVSILHINKIW